MLPLTWGSGGGGGTGPGRAARGRPLLAVVPRRGLGRQRRGLMAGATAAGAGSEPLCSGGGTGPDRAARGRLTPAAAPQRERGFRPAAREANGGGGGGGSGGEHGGGLSAARGSPVFDGGQVCSGVEGGCCFRPRFFRRLGGWRLALK